MKKDYGYPSYELICQAASGEEIALMEILKFYESYISKLCLRPFYHENGTVSMIVDEEWKCVTGFNACIHHGIPFRL